MKLWLQVVQYSDNSLKLLFLFNRSRLNKFLAWRKLREWETSKIVFYKVLTKIVLLDKSQKPKEKDQQL